MSRNQSKTPPLSAAQIRDLITIGDAEAELFFDHTDHLGKLFTALAEAQKDMPEAPKSAWNDFKGYKYADLTDVVHASRHIAKHGLSITQWPVGKNRLITILGHSSGEWIRGDMRMIPKNFDPQEIGKIVSYMRRYVISAIVNIANQDESPQAQAEIAEDDKFDPHNQDHKRAMFYICRDMGIIEKAALIDCAKHCKGVEMQHLADAVNQWMDGGGHSSEPESA